MRKMEGVEKKKLYYLYFSENNLIFLSINMKYSIDDIITLAFAEARIAFTK